MHLLALVFLISATLVALIYGVQLLLMAFRTSVLWGLGYIFVPFVALIFVAMHWDETKEPFLRGLLAIPLYLLGGALLPHMNI